MHRMSAAFVWIMTSCRKCRVRSQVGSDGVLIRLRACPQTGTCLTTGCVERMEIQKVAVFRRTFLPLLVAFLAAVSLAGFASAHSGLPKIVEIETAEGRIFLTLSVSAEDLISQAGLPGAGVPAVVPGSAVYDSLRALSAHEMTLRLQDALPALIARMRLAADGTALILSADHAEVIDEPNLALPRRSILKLSATLPSGANSVTFGWDAAFGEMVLRQAEGDAPLADYVRDGKDSPPIPIKGVERAPVTGLAAFATYIPVGFDHIVPKGLDHILFVLGLFFLSTRLSPLLWQVTAFTLAHTVTLALSALGYVALPGSVVEPLIAASIVFVAVENIWAAGRLAVWRPALVFGFGLLHGMGFAAVLGEFGLPEHAVIPALLGFNVGVELGQLAVLAVAGLLFWTWAARQSWYRVAIVVPASLAIAAVGSFWVLERTLL